MDDEAQVHRQRDEEEGSQGLGALLGEDDGDEGEDADGGVLHDPVDDLIHGLDGAVGQVEHGRAGFGQARVLGILDVGQGQAEGHGEEDDREHVALGQ